MAKYFCTHTLTHTGAVILQLSAGRLAVNSKPANGDPHKPKLTFTDELLQTPILTFLTKCTTAVTFLHLYS